MQPQKIKLVTTDPTLQKWRSLPSKLKAIMNELRTIKNSNFADIVIEYRKVTPAVVNGRITHEWMDGISGPELAQGFAFVGLHMSLEQRNKWNLMPSVRGVAQNDFDLVQEFYFWADEYTRGAGGNNQFVQTFLHEFRHGFMRGTKRADDTHIKHADGDIRGDFSMLDMRDYNPLHRQLENRISVLQALILSLSKKPTLYQAALRRLGTDASPKDLAHDGVGCAESVSNIINDVDPTFPIILGTWTMNEYFKKHPARFRRVTVPMPGTILMYASGTLANAPYPGHVLIFGEGEKLMSNTSATGLFEQNYTLSSARKRWRDKGFPEFMYQLI